MAIISIILFITVIIISNQLSASKKTINNLQKRVSKLWNENKKLKEKISNLENCTSNELNNSQLDEKNDIDLYDSNYIDMNVQNDTSLDINITNEKYEDKSEENIQQINKDKMVEVQNKRNNTILSIGAAFIIIAAISFLCWTWGSLPNILKTGVILILGVIFLVLSKIADSAFKLPKTSKTFFYIAMAYFPICLLSISVLGLIGDFFSISGAGNFIYLAISSFLVMSLYLFFGYKNKDNKLYCSGMIMQILFCIFSSGIINMTEEKVMTVLLIYFALLSLLVEKFETKFKHEADIFCKIGGIGTYIMTSITIFINIGTYILPSIASLIYIIAYTYVKEKKLKYLVYGTSIILLYNILNHEILSVSIQIIQMILIAYLVVSLIYFRFRKYDDYKLNIINIITFLVLYGISLLSYKDAISISALSNISFLFFLISYLTNKRKIKKTYIISQIMNLIMFVCGIFLNISEIGLIIGFLVSTVTLIFVHNEKIQYLKIVPSIAIMICLYTYNSIFEGIEGIIYLLNIFAIFVFGYLSLFDKKELVYKISSFIFLLGLIQIININYTLATLLVLLWCALQISLGVREHKDYMRYIAITSISIMHVIMLINYDSESIAFYEYAIGIFNSLFVLALVLKNKYLKIIPLVEILVPLYTYDIKIIESFDFSIIINLLLIVVITCSSLIGRNKKNLVIASFVHLMVFAIKYEEINIYIKLIMTIIWSIVYLICLDENKDFIKGVFAISSYMLYLNVIVDLNLSRFASINAFGLMVTYTYIIRNIVVKHFKGYKTLDYIVYSLIYITSILDCSISVDIALFIIVQVIFIIYSYLRRYGTLFASTVFGIILNLIYVTRHLWLSIPWWIYLLVAGAILITFAARNEIVEKTNRSINKEQIKEKIGKIKQFLDM